MAASPWLVHLAWIVAGLCRATAAGASPEAIEFFEKRVRPVLVDQCYSCHSAGSEKLKGGLHLDSRDGVLGGGDSGPAVVPGDPETSLLIKAVRYGDKDLQMPPRNQKLTDRQIDDLTAWVRMGVPWPAEAKAGPTLARRAFEITEKDRAFWAFQPIRRPNLPAVRRPTWVASEIDAFVLAKLDEKGLTPNPPATRRELIRRVYFDLLGLPPSPVEVAAFVQDRSPQAYERLVDRLLAQPQYGERWARHWLDVVRYAQSNGYERDGEKPLAWRYRDYVIQALNEDKPYDRFLQEQIAGDELPDGTTNALIATGFQRLGVWDDEPDDKAMAEYDALDDVVSTTGAAFLGLTLGCARCHDHKFDPISQADYYRFLAFFRNVRPYENARYTLDSPNYLPLAARDQVRAWDRDRQARQQALEARLAALPDGPEKSALRAQCEKVKAEPPPFEWALAVREHGPNPMPTHVLIRGNASTPGPAVEPAFPTILGEQRPVFAQPPPDVVSTGRRLALAHWMTIPENPLTARVAVNRVWHHHFGKGIVKTTTDFGRVGTPPTHPLLLDWLAAEFIDSGWSLKKLHRRILLSATYRMSSRSDNSRARAADPANDFLWRQNLRRLEAEGLWDAALSVGGELNPQMGGRGFFPHLEGEVLAGESRPGADWEISSPDQQARRSIYSYLRRTMLVPLFEAFDYSNTSSPLAERPVTTVAPQALMLLNSAWAHERAAAFAARLAREAGSDPRGRVRHGYALAFGRQPTSAELRIALDFVRRQTQAEQTIRGRQTFRPEVPNSLFGDYLKQLAPADYLRGPRDGWTYYRGHWSPAYEGIRTVDRVRGPFALWQGDELADGTIEADLVLHPASEFGSLLLRSVAQGDEQRGYEVVCDSRQPRVILRRHTDGVEVLAEGPAPVQTARPLSARIELEGARIRVWLRAGPASGTPSEQADQPGPSQPADGWGTPIIEVIDPQPITGNGRVGVRTCGAPLSLDRLTVRGAPPPNSIAGRAKPESVAGGPPPPGNGQPDLVLAQRAWQSFCLMLLNLNEFVYVD